MSTYVYIYVYIYLYVYTRGPLSMELAYTRYAVQRTAKVHATPRALFFEHHKKLLISRQALLGVRNVLLGLGDVHQQLRSGYTGRALPIS